MCAFDQEGSHEIFDELGQVSDLVRHVQRLVRSTMSRQIQGIHAMLCGQGVKARQPTLDIPADAMDQDDGLALTAFSPKACVERPDSDLTILWRIH
jgi:hypothetical protein